MEENNVMNENEINENTTASVAVVEEEKNPAMGAKETIKLGAAYGAAVGAGVIVGFGIGDLIVRGMNRGLHWVAGKLEKKKPDKEQATEVTPSDKEVK